MRALQRIRLLPLLCAVVLSGCDGGEEEDRQTKILGLEGDAMAGEAVFTGTCAAADCHGPDGQGGPDAPTSLAPLSDLVPAREDDAIVRVMLEGLGEMEPLAAELTDQQMADALAYVNEQFGP